MQSAKRIIFWGAAGCGTAVLALVILVLLKDWPSGHDAGSPNGSGREISEEKAFISERKRRLKGGLEMSEPDRFAAFYRMIRTGAGASAPSYGPNYQINALQKARAAQRSFAAKYAAGSADMTWQERGPGNVAGRARAVLVDPDDPTQQTWYVGSASGGVWKTEDAGRSWRDLTGGLPNLATTTLAMPASNTTVMYAGTGEGYGSFAFVYGQGIWKSEDKGGSWMQLEGTAGHPNFTKVLRLIGHPQNENVLIAATSTGVRSESSESAYIMRSTNGGLTWEAVYSSDNRIEQVLASPGDFQMQYATVHGKGILKSVDGGLTWREIFDPFIWPAFKPELEIGRLEMAIAPSDPARLYVVADGGLTESTLYVSNDAGDTWNVVENIVGVDPVDWLGDLGWYSNALAVHPQNPDNVYVGGIDIYQFDVSDESFGQGFLKEVVEYDPSRFLLVDIIVGAPTVAPKLGGNPEIDTGDFYEVEIRFGPTKKQKAHRFEGKWLTLYKEYIDIELEAWDVKNNRQLTLAFEDLDADSRWDMAGGLGDVSERLFVIDEEYNPTTPHEPTIADPFTRALYVVVVKHEMDEGVDNGPFPEAQLNIIPELRTYRASEIARVTEGYGESYAASKGVHVDHHQLLFVPSNEAGAPPILLDANDGGVAVSYDMGATFRQTGDTFAQLFGGIGNGSRPLSGLNTTQFFGADKMNGKDRFVGGTQDNGSWVSPDLMINNAAPWLLTRDGDGFEAIWHYENPDWLIQSSQFNTIARSLDGGQSWDDISPGGSSVFLTRVAKSNRAPDLLLVATPLGVARSEDFGSTWERINVVSIWPDNTNPTVTISLASPEIVWTGAAMDGVLSFFVSQDGGRTFDAKEGAHAFDIGPVTNLATHPSDSQTAFALFSVADRPKVLRTTDMGESWEDISGFGDGAESTNGFPDVAVYSLLVMPHDEQILWAGTEIGILESADGGANWHLLEADLPAVAVWQMRVVNDQVVIATHGRGVWTATIPELANYEPAANPSPVILNVEGGFDGRFVMDVNLRQDFDSTRVIANDEIVRQLPADSVGVTRLLVDVISDFDSEAIEFHVEGYREGQIYISNIVESVFFALPDPVDRYVFDFDRATGDFLLDGFALDLPFGFTTQALHSTHPYPDFYEATAGLLIPIRVKEDDSKLGFREIALVEAGEEGAPFGSERFYDYVVVEGSRDKGLTWHPLEDGYDVRRESKWGNDVQIPPNSSFFADRVLDLQPVFAPGEEVLLRFRMKADNAGVGWGWAIDNLVIQDDITVSTAPDAQTAEFALSQNYPNPFSTQTTIRYSLAQPSSVTLSIYDINGRKVQQLAGGAHQPAGAYEATWDGTTLWGGPAASGVYFYQLDAGPYRKTRKLVLY